MHFDNSYVLSDQRLQPLKAFAFFGLILSVTIFTYSQGWSGGWHFDDAPNLRGLIQIFSQGRMDTDAALEFVFGGNAGPLGRPLALASFLVDGSTWPLDPQALLYTNTLIHAINGFLVWAVLFNLGRAQDWHLHKAVWLASIGASLWLLQPLSVSGVLMAVQRMALLSSSFMLLGLWLYLLARQRLGQPKWSVWLGMAASLGICTLLGVFTKEQAGILPILVWVLEACWLPQPVLECPRQRYFWKIFKTVFFYIPAISIAAYLIYIVWHADSAYSMRDFNLNQRLWTQFIILWDYLRLTFLPRAVAFGPFHDDYTIYDANSLLAWFAVAIWLLAVVLAFALRRTTRLPLFVLLWFATAHLVESTVIPLELYFEHRNYLALIGPIFGIAVAAWAWAEKFSKNTRSSFLLLKIALGLYTLILLAVLWQTTSLFGQPAVAAKIWHERHPRSMRAAQFFAQNLVNFNRIPDALQVLDDTAKFRSNSGILSLQGFQLACVLNHPHGELQNRFNLVLQEISLASRSTSIIETLDNLNNLRKSSGCNGFIKNEHLIEISQVALKNSYLSRYPQDRSNLHIFIAIISMEKKDFALTIQNLLSALEVRPNLQNLQITALVLESAGIGKEMEEILENHPLQPPRNPWVRKRLEKEWEELRNKVKNQN